MYAELVAIRITIFICFLSVEKGRYLLDVEGKLYIFEMKLSFIFTYKYNFSRSSTRGRNFNFDQRPWYRRL